MCKPTNRLHRGRPRIPDADRRDFKLTIRLTQEQRVLLEHAADQAGVTMAQFMIQAMTERFRACGPSATKQ